jgi:hypothetical protein
MSSVNGVNGYPNTGSVNIVSNPSERYLIGAGLYCLEAFNSFGSFYNFEPSAYYCWCLFKQIRHPDQSLTVELVEVIQSVLIRSNGANEWIDITMTDETTAERIAVCCLNADNDALRYPDHVFLYGSADDHTDVHMQWEMLREFLDILNAHLAAIHFSPSPIFIGVNNYIYSMLGSLLGIHPFMMEDYPLSDSVMLPPVVRLEPIQIQMHNALSEGQIAQSGHAFFENGLPTPPPSPVNSDIDDETISLTI